MKQVAIYSRKSVLTDTGDSIENQVQKVKNYFSNEDCNFLLFEDEGWSGKNDKRPDFQRMMTKVRNNEIDVIAVYMLDRVSRNVVDFVNFYDTIKKHSVEFISVTEGFNLSTPMGKMHMYFLSIFAENERENISRRVKDNKIYLSQQGIWCGGKAPTGYKLTKLLVNNKKTTYLELQQDSKDIIINIFDKYLELGSLHKVQKWLIDEYSLKFSLSTVKYILSSPVYCIADNDSFKYLSNIMKVFGEPNGETGYIVYDNRKFASNKKDWKSDSMFAAISKHKAIIPSYKWIQVQELQKDRAVAPRPKASNISYFTNVLRCSICNSPMTLSYNHKTKDGIKHYYYVCTGKKSYGASYCSNKWLKQNEGDEKIITFLEDITSNKSNFLSSINQKFNKNTLDIEIEKIEKDIKIKNNELKKLTNDLKKIEANIARDIVIEEMNNIGNSIESLKTKLDILERKAYNQKHSVKSLDVIYTELKNMTILLREENIDINKKRELVNMFIKEIRWDGLKDELSTVINI